MQRRLVVLSGFVALFYFSEGFPYGIVNELFPIYLRESGVSLARIGFFTAVGWMWTLKFFWSPLVDTLGTYRRWISIALLLIAAMLAPFAFADLAHSPALWVLVVIVVIGSATQDIAVDAYTIAMTPQQHVGTINAIRITAYRVSIILTGGAMSLIATAAGWRAAFAVAVGVTILLLLASFIVPEEEQRQQRARTESTLLADLRDWIRRPQAGAILAVVLLYRVGDSALRPMIKPFWVDRGYSAAEIGTVTTSIGFTFTIIGGLLGGWFVNRFGVYRALLWLGLAQMLSNIGYAIAASIMLGRPGMYAVALTETFCDGLGVSAFLAFLMAICDRTRAATEYALLSGLFALSRTGVGMLSGVGAQALGYSPFFWLTVALAIPGLLCLPLIRARIGDYGRAAPIAEV